MSADLELRLPIVKIDNSSSDDEEFCRTPRSPRHMIPAVLRCPPAPKKRRSSAAAACRRRLCELQFFEVASREEVESLFRNAQVSSSSSSAKRNCFL